MLLLPPLWTSRRAWAGLVSLPLAHGSLLLFHITSVPTHKSAFPSLPHTHKSLYTSSRVTPLPAQGQLGQNRALYFLYPPPSPFLPFSIIFLISPPSLLPPFLPGQHCQHYLLFFCHLLLTYKLKRFSELSSLLYLTLYFSPTNWGNPGTPASEHILCPSQIPNDNVPLSGQKRKPTTKEVLFYF